MRNILYLFVIAVAFLSQTGSQHASDFELKVTQLTRGPQHHFFGYIGQSLTTPWNKSGRYILSLRTTFHDHMPTASDAADIVLLDTQDHYRVIPIEKTRAWNFQQGTMFYWNPKKPETQFFFNDRDPQTNLIFTVLYDIERKQRVREYRFTDVPVANGGVAPTGEFFLAINYARMARLRPVTGYPETHDPTSDVHAPDNDGVFRIDIESGDRTLLVSFKQLRDLLQDRHPKMDEVGFYINHSLSSRDGQYVYFYARGEYQGKSMDIDVPCSVRTDGTELTAHQYIGGHPEWDEGPVVIGTVDGRQIRYDIKQRKIISQIATPDIIAGPGGDIALAPNPDWFVCGYATDGGKRMEYVVVRRSDTAFAKSETFSRGPYTRGDLRIDPAPKWNRDSKAVLFPVMTDDGTRQLHLITIE